MKTRAKRAFPLPLERGEGRGDLLKLVDTGVGKLVGWRREEEGPKAPCNLSFLVCCPPVRLTRDEEEET